MDIVTTPFVTKWNITLRRVLSFTLPIMGLTATGAKSVEQLTAAMYCLFLLNKFYFAPKKSLACKLIGDPELKGPD